jgi:hypothetical protein
MALQVARLIAGLMASMMAFLIAFEIDSLIIMMAFLIAFEIDSLIIMMAFLIAFEIDSLIIMAMRSSGCKGTLLRVCRRERRGAAYVDGCAACTRGGQGGGMGLEAQAGRCLVQVPSQVRRDYLWPKPLTHL